MKVNAKLWVGLGLLALLSPLGLLIPYYFKSGTAWGEWGADELKELAGYIPRGLERLSGIWNAPFADYVFKGWEEKGLAALSLAYIFSAVVGIALTVAVILFLGRLLIKRDDQNAGE